MAASKARAAPPLGTVLEDNDEDRSGEDVKELTATQDRVTIRLRRGGDDANWITELVCFLFNAQGEVLQVARGAPASNGSGSNAGAGSSAKIGNDDFFGEDGNLVVRRQRAKDAVEKELLAFSFSKLHAFVEVVGCLVTYSEDEIAKNPRLNEFLWSCDLCTSDSEEESKYLGERPLRAFEYYHDPKAKAKSGSGGNRGRGDSVSGGSCTQSPLSPSPNFVVMCKFYRNHKNRNEWFFHAIGEPGAVRSSITPVLTEAMQVFLLDIIPEIEIPNRNALTSVLAVCAALNFDEFLGIEKYFPDIGIGKDDFARIILFALVQSRPELQRVGRASALVALLFEMFEQIDINGDAVVDWEEFTTFCMSLGLIATSEQDLGGAGLRATSYRQEHVGGAKARNFPYQISKIKSFPQLKRIAVVENKSAVVLMYDCDLVLHHEMNAVEKLLGKESDPAILDVDHIASRNLLAISSNDHSITLWSIVNPLTGAYVFFSKIVNRYPVVFLKWCSPLKRLIASGAEYTQLWDIDTQRVDARLNHHKDRISDYVELGNSGFFATCSFDHTIAVWESSTQKVAFALEGHIQGVLTMDYTQNILLSSGFEYQAYCWSITLRSLLVTLGGHQHRLIGAKFVSNRSSSSSSSSSSAAGTAIAVTGDESGHFKLWDLSRCVRGSTTDLARVLQSFELHTPNLCRFQVFACGMSSSTSSTSSGGSASRNTENELADILVGNLQLYRFRATTQAEESAPPRHVVYNTVANTFVGSVDGCITVWNANSGVKVEEPIQIRDTEVCGLVFDVPRERKLFIATSDGCIRLYNPITGMLMTKSQIHDGIISSLLFCPRTCCLISTGYDRNICVSHSTAGKTDVEVLRTVENAHDSCITACAFSAELDLVATGDDFGCIHVYDFEKLYLLFRCESHRHEIRALHFHSQAPLLVSGDSNGVVFIWQATGVVYTASPLMRLALHASTSAVPGTPKSPHTPSSSSCQATATHGGSSLSARSTKQQQQHLMNAPPVTSICSTVESPQAQPSILVACEDGEVYVWDFRVIAGVARKRAIAGTHFEFFHHHQVEATDQVPSSFAHHEAYNPLLRVAHKQSVLKLRPEDRNGVRNELAGGISSSSSALRNAGEHHHTHNHHSGVVTCPSTFSWNAHNETVLAIKCVSPDPGVVFTFSQDGRIKIWDAAHECVGTISTLDGSSQSSSSSSSLKPGQSRQSEAPGNSSDSTVQSGSSQSSSSSSAWKFTHHLNSDASHRHAQIAAEVIRKHKRRKQKAHRQQGGLTKSRIDRVRENSDADTGDGDSTTEEEADNRDGELQQSDLRTKSPTKTKGKPTGIEAILTAQLPFSNDSLRSGVQQGLFGPSESRQLKELSLNSAFMSSVSKKSTLTPLSPFSPGELTKVSKKKRSTSSSSNHTSSNGNFSEKECNELSMMRTMTNFPLEMQRRAAMRPHNAAMVQALDIAPSPFLQEKLSESSSSSELLLRRGPKSTPNRKVKLMHMDPSVVVTRNVSLPKLPEASISILSAPSAYSNSDEPPSPPASFAKNSTLLSTSASAPALAGSGGSHLSAMKTSYSDIATAIAVVDNEELKRTNIERKLKLYEDIIATSDSETSHSSESSERGATKRRSQPYIPVWKTSASPKAAATGGNANGNMPSQSPIVKRHSVLSMKTNANDGNNSNATGPQGFAHNPFGPFYTVKQVIEFGNIITRFDENFSGDIDQQEWVSMLQSFRPIFGQSDQEATERLFRSLDRDDSGRISLQEILSAMFSKATPEQLQKMKLFLRTHTETGAKKQKQKQPLKGQTPQQQ